MRDYLVEGCDIPEKFIAVCHSKLKNREKEEDRFRTGSARIMVATSAFGMGVNIPDIRLVVVAQLPFSVAGFYQMAGRAGRDGEKAKVLLLYNGADYQMNLDIIGKNDARASQEADAMYHICESEENFHKQILHHFTKEDD